VASCSFLFEKKDENKEHNRKLKIFHNFIPFREIDTNVFLNNTSYVFSIYNTEKDDQIIKKIKE
jgi:hypothetical protein